MKRAAAAVGIVLLLAGCVAPPARPPRLFDSPLAAPGPYRIFVPGALSSPGKFGLSMALQHRSCAYPAQVGASWYYDWSPQPLDCPGREAVPMLWAPGDGVSNPPSASAYLLLLNECDRPDQCNTSPEAAAIAWRQWEQQYPERRLVGPNASNAGLDWLLAWHAAYLRLYGEPPRLWALGIHCYKGLAWCQDWTTANIALAQQWTESGRVWVTEWAMPLPDADVFAAWLLANPGVERAAWYLARSPAENSSLYDWRDGLTGYGVWHRDVLQTHD